jgi:hypothetical protein
MILISYFWTAGTVEMTDGFTFTVAIGFNTTNSLILIIYWLILVAEDSLYTYLFTIICLPLVDGEIRVKDEAFDWGVNMIESICMFGCSLLRVEITEAI